MSKSKKAAGVKANPQENRQHSLPATGLLPDCVGMPWCKLQWEKGLVYRGNCFAGLIISKTSLLASVAKPLKTASLTLDSHI